MDTRRSKRSWIWAGWGRWLLVLALGGGVAGVASGVLFPPAAVAQKDPSTEAQKDLDKLKDTQKELDGLKAKPNPTPQEQERIDKLTKRVEKLEGALKQWLQGAKQGFTPLQPGVQQAIEEYFELKDLKAQLKDEESKKNPDPKKVERLKKRIAELEAKDKQAEKKDEKKEEKKGVRSRQTFESRMQDYDNLRAKLTDSTGRNISIGFGRFESGAFADIRALQDAYDELVDLAFELDLPLSFFGLPDPIDSAGRGPSAPGNVGAPSVNPF